MQLGGAESPLGTPGWIDEYYSCEAHISTLKNNLIHPK